jgi:preprotein translocase subunit SecA
LEYDDISNEQRKLIYQQRNFILDNKAETLLDNIISNYVLDFVDSNYDDLNSQDIKLSDINEPLKKDFLIDINIEDSIRDNIINLDMFKDNLKLLLTNKINECTKNIPPKDYDKLIVNICLAVIDEEYRNHLSSMDYLRQSIGLRGYAQKNPKNEYKRESFEMFNLILMDISKEILKICCRIRIDNYNAGSQERISPDTNNNFANQNISRNALCPCGSGKKYKRCCGKLK